MCQLIAIPGNATSQDQFCPHMSKYQCSSGLDCLNAMQNSAPFLCKLHAEFCKFCGQPFCPSCIEDHEADCSKRDIGRPNESTAYQWPKAS
jgi:hypothetical protein